MTNFDDIEQLFRSHYAPMYRFAMIILRDDNASRDIVHDVFESLLVSGKSEVSEAYLLKAVRNRCVNHSKYYSWPTQRNSPINSNHCHCPRLYSR